MKAQAKTRAGIARKRVGGSAKRRGNPIPTAMLTAIQSQLGSKLTSEGLKRVGKAYKANPGKGAFECCVAAVTTKGGAADPRAVCAAAGRKKYGAKKFQAMAKAGKRKHAKRSNPARKNPEDAAAARYESFHGREPESVTEVTRTIHEHSVLSGIGKLVQLDIAAIDGKGIVEVKGFRGALLAQNEKATQLFIEGGDQKVSPGDFGIKHPHEKEVLGACVAVWYDTQKDHLGRDGGKAVYHHKFGGKGSRLPMIVYDVPNQLLEFAGGGYTLPDVGIDG